MSESTLTIRSKVRCHGGLLGFYSADSTTCHGPMRFSVFMPPSENPPVLFWLSGLTCTEENFMIKAGAQRLAAELGICLVAPDTSPRMPRIPGDDDDWSFGQGAGFYVDATQAPWAPYYSMYSFVTRELPDLVVRHFPVDMTRKSVFGHSMGGHGALVCALREPDQYRSVSAFAPICAPRECAWGRGAFGKFLGKDWQSWKVYDATDLIKASQTKLPLLVDQGDADPFLDQQLRPDLLRAACEQAGHPLTLNMRAGYDHSYYFIATFIDEHLRYHAEALFK